VLKAWLKRAAHAVAPGPAGAFFAARDRECSHRAARSWGVPRVNDFLFDRFGDRVLAGPFRGLTLTPMTRAEMIGPCLLGTYEKELHAAWDVVLRGEFPQICDVGAKVGYYAVGLARRFPTSRVLAFDIDPWARRVLAEMVAANATPNVEIRGSCRPSWLAEGLAPGAFILSDCEGYEGELLGSVPIPNLATATLIVETHDMRAPGVSDRIRERLGPTHRVAEIVEDEATSREDLAAGLDLGGLSEDEKRLATREVRSPQGWLFCLPREGPNAGLEF
jgi:hypothetical protein